MTCLKARKDKVALNSEETPGKNTILGFENEFECYYQFILLNANTEGTSSAKQYLKIVDCTTQEPTMGRVTKMANVYNPY